MISFPLNARETNMNWTSNWPNFKHVLFKQYLLKQVIHSDTPVSCTHGSNFNLCV